MTSEDVCFRNDESLDRRPDGRFSIKRRPYSPKKLNGRRSRCTARPRSQSVLKLVTYVKIFKKTNTYKCGDSEVSHKKHDLDQYGHLVGAIPNLCEQNFIHRNTGVADVTAAPSRRAFLRGRFEAPVEMRPFGALAEPAFLEACTGCGDCAAACPEAILFKGEGGYPRVDISNNGCSFCGDCIEACETGALVPDRPWPWSISIAESCLSTKGVECRACQDFCDARAIRFRPVVGGKVQMDLDSSLCTGCGFCVAPCPVDAISLTRKQSQPTEASYA